MIYITNVLNSYTNTFYFYIIILENCLSVLRFLSSEMDDAHN